MSHRQCKLGQRACSTTNQRCSQGGTVCTCRRHTRPTIVTDLAPAKQADRHVVKIAVPAFGAAAETMTNGLSLLVMPAFYIALSGNTNHFISTMAQQLCLDKSLRAAASLQQRSGSARPLVSCPRIQRRAAFKPASPANVRSSVSFAARPSRATLVTRAATAEKGKREASGIATCAVML